MQKARQGWGWGLRDGGSKRRKAPSWDAKDVDGVGKWGKVPPPQPTRESGGRRELTSRAKGKQISVLSKRHRTLLCQKTFVNEKNYSIWSSMVPIAPSPNSLCICPWNSYIHNYYNVILTWIWQFIMPAKSIIKHIPSYNCLLFVAVLVHI